VYNTFILPYPEDLELWSRGDDGLYDLGQSWWHENRLYELASLSNKVEAVFIAPVKTAPTLWQWSIAAMMTGEEFPVLDLDEVRHWEVPEEIKRIRWIDAKYDATWRRSHPDTVPHDTDPDSE